MSSFFPSKHRHPARVLLRSLALALACTVPGLAKADIVSLLGGLPLPTCPQPGFSYSCVVEGQAVVNGVTGAPIEKVRISRIAGYNNRAELQIGTGASLMLNSVVSVVDGYADLVVGDNVGTAGTLIVRDGGQLSISGTSTNQGGLFIGFFSAPSDAPLGLGGIPVPSTSVVIKDGGYVSVDRPGLGALASASVSVGRGLGSNSSLVMDGGIGNFGSAALGATLNTNFGYVSVGREGTGLVDMPRNATLQSPQTFMSVISPTGQSTLVVGFRSVVTGDVIAGIGVNPSNLQPDPGSTSFGTAHIVVKTEGRINGIVTLGKGGSLSGTGGVGTLFNYGGVVKPGNSPGTLTIGAGGFTDVGGQLEIEFGSSGKDKLVVQGPVSLTGTRIEFRFIEGYAPAAGESFEFLTTDGSVPSLVGLHYSFSGLEPGFQFDVATGAGGQLVFNAINSGVALVPEPGSVALMLLGLLGLAGVAARQRYLVPNSLSPASPRPGTM